MGSSSNFYGGIYSRGYTGGYSGGYSSRSYSEQSSRRERPSLKDTLEQEGFSKKEIYVLPEKPKQKVKQDETEKIIDVDFVDVETTKKSILELPEKAELNSEKAKLDLECHQLAREREEFEKQKSILEFHEKVELNSERAKLNYERAILDCERASLDLERHQLAREREEFEKQKSRKRNRLFELISRFILRRKEKERYLGL